MAIVLKKGEAERAAGVGKAIGQARLVEQQRQIKMQQAAEDRAMQWELEKAEMRSRQDFEKELRDRQFAIDAEERARQWQIEKMELASRMDFEQEEKERLRKKAIFNSGIESIDNSDAPDMRKDEAKFQLAMKYTDIEEAAQYLGLKQQFDKKEAPEIKRTDVDAAIKFLQEYKEKEQKSKSILHPFAPKPTEEEITAAKYYQGVLEQTNTIPIAINTDIPPQTEEEFYNNVAKLKSIDMIQAKTYYNKYVDEF